MKMTSRERVMRAIEGKEVDRAPVNFRGIVEGSLKTGQQEPPYGIRSLYAYLGIADYDQPMGDPDGGVVINVDERLLLRLGADCRSVYTGMRLPDLLADGSTRDMYGIVTPPAAAGVVAPDSKAPLKNATSVRDIEAYPYWPDPQDPDFTVGIPEYIKTVRESTACALILYPVFTATIFHMYGALRGFNNWLMDMRRNERFYFALADKIAEIATGMLSAALPRIGANIDIIYYGDDVGMQTQPFMSLEMYRRFVKPYSKRWVHTVKGLLPHVKVIYHTCGSVFDFIPDFIDCGIDILDSLQPLAYKMEPWRLKKVYGDRICFQGGIDIQRLVNFGTPSQIKERVKETLAIFEGCRYILSTAHVIEPDAPPENIVAVFDAAAEYASCI